MQVPDSNFVSDVSFRDPRDVVDLRNVQSDLFTRQDIADTGKEILIKNEPVRLAFSFPKWCSVDFFSFHLEVAVPQLR